MWACNYDFVCDDSHSSDLNVALFCEGKRQHFDEVLHLERERGGVKEDYSFTPEKFPQPTPLLLLSPVSVTLAAGMPYQAGDKNKELEE